MAYPDFETPGAAEEAFYDAFARGDIEAMESVWEASNEIECIHPMGERLTGQAVLDSWREMFERAEPVAFQLTERREMAAGEVAIHRLIENIHFQDKKAQPLRLLTTNIYRRSQDGWRMVVRHCSPAPMDAVHEGQSVSHAVH